MKLDVTYEKADILRLIERDLRERNIPPKAGVPLVYRGALHVRLSVEIDEREEVVSSERRASSGDRPAATAPTIPSPPVEAEVDLAEVLAASQRLEAEGQPRFEITKKRPRPLAPNEFYDEPHQ